MRVIGIIPCRYESSRFPGKPLAIINGKPMMWHVYQRALESNILDEVYIATDDERIAKVALEYSLSALMTNDKHETGTDRVAEAASQIQADYYVNIQGDEPFMPISLIGLLVDDYKKNKCDVITASHLISSNLELQNPNCVKVDKKESNFAYDFLRHVEHQNIEKLFRHIGIYGYSHKTLKKLVCLEPTQRELEHKLEQLRFLDNNYSIYVTQYDELVPSGIDTQEDVESALLFIKKNDC